MVRVEEISDSSALLERKEMWDALVAGSPQATIFDSFEWVMSWLDAFWENRTMRFLFFWSGKRLLGIAPLLPDKTGDVWCARSLVSPVNRNGNRTSIICPENPAAVLEALCKYLKKERQFSRIGFPNVLASVPVSMMLPEIAARHKMATLVSPGVSSPIIRVSGDWESYLKTRSSHLAKEMKRKVKRLNSSAHAETIVVSSPDQCGGATEDMLQIERCSWKEQNSISLSTLPRLAKLYEKFAMSAAQSGLLRLYLLYLDSKPVAYIYGVVFKGEFYAFKTSYDAAYRELSPGIVLFDRMFRDSFDQGLSAIDLGLGSSMRWKDEFANDVREHVNVCLFTSLCVRCRSCKSYQLRLKPLLKKHLPKLVDLKRKLSPNL
jgi:hypothetical protein